MGKLKLKLRKSAKPKTAAKKPAAKKAVKK
jgi:hypothetical protein